MEPFLAEMSSKEVASLLERHDLDVLVPLGALEQHGPHLPLGTDSFIVEEIAARVAERAGDLVVVPCLPIGCSDHHLDFAGTASIERATLAAYLRSSVSTLLRHGFRYAFVISGHAGNNPAMQVARDLLDREVPGRVMVLADWPAQRGALHDFAERELGMRREEVGSHAGHFETSIMMAISPEKVEAQLLTKGFIGPSERASSVLASEGMSALSAVGVIGDARRSSAEAGAGYLEVLVGLAVREIENHRSSGGVKSPDQTPPD